MALQYIETEGKTTEEALELALRELGVSREQVTVKVLNEGSKGILGFGAKHARVRVTLKEDPSTTPEGVLGGLLERMGIEARIRSEVIDGSIHLVVDARSPGLLIGRHGQTLDAVQYLLNCILNKSALVKKKVIVDTEGYREKREEMLVELAHRMAYKVRQTGQEIVMEPMPPRDRRIIHITLQDDDRVRTFSRGEGPIRSVVITTRDRYESKSSSERHYPDEAEGI